MEELSKNDIFQRTRLLTGEAVFDRLSQVKVLLIGVGGVGSWCAESLVRSGISNLTIVDSDVVAVSNLNRQLMATVHSIGQSKVSALKERLLSINPQANITALQKTYSAETSESFNLASYDYIIDAIDTLKNKLHLISSAADCGAVFFSSMGSALKVDPSRIKVGDFWKVRDCPLGAALRKRLRQTHTAPSNSFLCVYSGEVLPNLGQCDPDELSAEAASSGKAVINGTTSHICAIFGMTLAGLLIKDIYYKANK